MKLDERKMAIAGAAVGAVGTLCAGIIGTVATGMGGGIYGRGMMSGYGYYFTPFRLLFGVVFALLTGLVAGYVLAWTYNRVEK